MAEKTSQQRYLERLAALAGLSGATLTKDMVALYDRGLKQFGYEALCGAVEEVIKRRRARDPFPSIADIAKILAPVVDDQDLAIDAANRVIQAIAKFGWNHPDEAKAFVGEIGWHIVERQGGWDKVCQMQTKDVPMFRAQYRELALSAIRRYKAGTLDLPPAFSHVAVTDGQKRVAALIGGTHGTDSREHRSVSQSPSRIGEHIKADAGHASPLPSGAQQGAKGNPGASPGQPHPQVRPGTAPVPGQLRDRPQGGQANYRGKGDPGNVPVRATSDEHRRE